MLDRTNIHIECVTFDAFQELRNKLGKTITHDSPSSRVTYAVIREPFYSLGSFGELCVKAAAQERVFRFSSPNLPPYKGWTRFYRPFNLAGIVVCAEDRGVLFVHTSVTDDNHELGFERDAGRIIPVEASFPRHELSLYQ